MTLLSVTGLHKNIGKKSVLADVSFSLAAGEIMAVLGPNGAGKTTLFTILAGLKKKHSGCIRYAGTAYDGAVFFQAEGIRYLPEEPVFELYLTGAEHLRLFSSLTTTPFEEALATANGLGLQGALHKRVGSYSLGMKRKLGLCLALMGKPRLVLLDEPVNGLDIIFAEKMYGLVKQVAEQGGSFIIASHNIAELGNICDKFMILIDGKVNAAGTLPDSGPGPAFALVEAVTSQPEPAMEYLRSCTGTLSVRVSSGKALFLEETFRNCLRSDGLP